MKAKIFICHHPAGMLFYKNLVQIVKKHNKDIKIILFKVNHPYFSNFNFQPYRQYFDEIIEFEFINYKKNFLKGLWEILVFQKKLKKIIADLLNNFKEIDLFLDVSAYLPINIILYNLSRQNNIKNITKFMLVKPGFSHTKVDRVKTFLCALYSLFFKCYKVNVISTLSGKFFNFNYVNKTPGNIFRIVSPIIAPLTTNFDHQKENILPYPVISKHSPVVKKDMVIIFGKKNIESDLSEYLPDYEIYIRKLTTLFEAIANKYSNCQLYYKSHPVDKGQIIPGIDTKKYSLFDNTVHAQELFDRYQERIRAIYAFSSSSVTVGSFFGIPSYTFYRYLCNQTGIERYDDYFSQDNIKSKFLFHISNLKEIGKIDNLKCPVIDSKKLEEIYRRVLYV